MSNPNRTVSICIMSGKGGVGKTNLALNLGYALHQAGHSSLLMDCDLGLANLDVLLGLTPDKNLQDLLTEGADARDVVTPIEPEGLDVLPAASGVPELVEMSLDMRETLMLKLMDLVGGYRFLLLDLGAGISQPHRALLRHPDPASAGGGHAGAHLPDRLLRHDQGAQFAVRPDRLLRLREHGLLGQGGQADLPEARPGLQEFSGLRPDQPGPTCATTPRLVEAVRKQKPFLKLIAPFRGGPGTSLALADKFIRYRTENREPLTERPPLRQFPAQ